jgi:hypothetical protein
MNSGASQKRNLPHPTFHIPDGSFVSCCFKNVLLVAACLMKNNTKGWSVLRGKPTDPFSLAVRIVPSLKRAEIVPFFIQPLVKHSLDLAKTAGASIRC